MDNTILPLFTRPVQDPVQELPDQRPESDQLSRNSDYNTYIEESVRYTNSEQTVVESWTIEKEEMILNWRKKILKDSDIHERASIKFKKNYKFENIVTICFSLTMAVMQLIFSYLDPSINSTVIFPEIGPNGWTGTITNITSISQESSNLSRVSFLLGGISSIILALIQHINNLNRSGQNYAENSQYSARYADIATKIEAEMAKTKTFRTVADLFIAEIRYNMSGLKNNAPPVI